MNIYELICGAGSNVLVHSSSRQNNRLAINYNNNKNAFHPQSPEWLTIRSSDQDEQRQSANQLQLHVDAWSEWGLMMWGEKSFLLETTEKCTHSGNKRERDVFLWRFATNKQYARFTDVLCSAVLLLAQPLCLKFVRGVGWVFKVDWTVLWGMEREGRMIEETYWCWFGIGLNYVCLGSTDAELLGIAQQHNTSSRSRNEQTKGGVYWGSGDGVHDGSGVLVEQPLSIWSRTLLSLIIE